MEFEDLDLNNDWKRLMYFFIRNTGKKPTTNTLLFLIGVNELGKGKRAFSKEEKQDLMHIATCKLLSISGYYEYDGIDQDGWPHYKQIKAVPKLSLEEQEDLLKFHMIEYFEEHIEEERQREKTANKSPNQKPIIKASPKNDTAEDSNNNG
jgi:hypothetical protein